MNYFTVKEFSYYANDVEQQVSIGVRNSIDTGYSAANYLLFSIFLFKSKDFPKKIKIISLPVLFCAIIILLRAGSRGPLLAVLIGLVSILALQKKNYLITLFISTVLILGFFFLFDEILELISKISPVMTFRIQSYLKEGEPLRIGFFMEGINGFINYPFTGSQALLYRSSGLPTSPHQLILEAFMSTGFIGGLCLIGVIYLVIKSAIFNLHNFVSNYWIELIILAYLTRAFTAGTILAGDYSIIFAYFLLARNRKSLFQVID